MSQSPEEFTGADLSAALESMSVDLRESVVAAIARAKEQRESESRAHQMKYTIAEFATALHLHEANRGQSGEPVDLIGWHHFTTSTAAAIIAGYDKTLAPIVPDSVKKTAAYVHASWEFQLSSTRDEVDRQLVPFGYPSGRILDDQVALSVATGHGTAEEIKSRLEPYLERIVFDDYIADLEQEMREELKSLGYQLPDLEDDNSYGHEPDGGDFYPQFSGDMLP